MHPTLCRVGPLTIYSFGVMVALAAIICSVLMARESVRRGYRSSEVVDFVFWTVLSGIVGARIFYVLLNISFFLKHPLQIVLIHEGGLAWQGGFFLAGVFVFVFIKKKHWPLWQTADFIAPYLALGHAIGRIGCFLNGCCYGREVPWGIYFPVHDAHLHPTQLYESLSLFILFFLLKYFQKKTQAGQTFAFYLIAASFIRFIVEFFRADHVPL
ncbi:MAG: prolipoprotein diacylglyceryl transferase, partial [Candidatus Omnitrophota bacterium]